MRFLASRPGTDIQPTWSVAEDPGWRRGRVRRAAASARWPLVAARGMPAALGGARRLADRLAAQEVRRSRHSRSRSSAWRPGQSTASRGRVRARPFRHPDPSPRVSLNRRSRSRACSLAARWVLPVHGSARRRLDAPHAGAELDDQVTGRRGESTYPGVAEHRTAPPMDNRFCGFTPASLGCAGMGSATQAPWPTAAPVPRRPAAVMTAGGPEGDKPGDDRARRARPTRQAARTRRVPSVSAGRPGLTREAEMIKSCRGRLTAAVAAVALAVLVAGCSEPAVSGSNQPGVQGPSSAAPGPAGASQRVTVAESSISDLAAALSANGVSDPRTGRRSSKRASRTRRGTRVSRSSGRSWPSSRPTPIPLRRSPTRSFPSPSLPCHPGEPV